MKNCRFYSAKFLNFTSGTEIKPVSLQEIVTHAYALPESIPHPIPLWVDYLRVGYFPFFREDDFYTRLDNVVNQTLEVDIPTYANMNISTSAKLKRLLYTFEVGGKNKKKRQIESVENGFVVKDDIEHGFLNTIPLWAFGLNY